MSETSDLRELPEGWMWTTIGEIADTSSGGTPSRGQTDYYGGSIPWVKSGELKDGTIFRTEEFITELGLRSSSAKVFPAGTLCIALYGATVGKLGVLGIDAATNQAVCGIFIPPLFVTQYLFHFLFWQRQNLIDLGKGGAQPNISQDIVRRTFIALPPFPEQQRIVAKIEELFTKLDAGVDALKKARAQLGRYRQAVLKAAVTGELTREWREAHRDELEPAADLLARILCERRATWEADQLARMQAAGKPPKNDDWKQKYQEPAAPDTSELPELPDEWRWIVSNSFFTFVTSGSRGWANHYSDSGPLFVRMGNLDHDSITLDLSHIQRVQPPNGIEGVRTRIQSGDILASITADVGMIAVVPENIEEAYINQHVALARPVKAINTEFLAWFLASQDGGQRQFKLLQRGATKTGLGLDDIRAVNVPLPPLMEQQQIVSEIERLFSIADSLEQTISQSLKQSERLRQSILQQAFAGKLVPQDPTDEPASRLLERIREERERRAKGEAPKQRRNGGGKREGAAQSALFS